MQTKSDTDILDEEFNKPSVFTDESRLSPDYVPDNLLFRQDQLKFLVRHFRGLFEESGMNRGIILTGPIGSGKTSMTRKFGIWAMKRGYKDHIKIRYIHVNCRINRTPYTIFLSIARELNSHIPMRGYSSIELLEMIVGIMDSKRIRILLVLDEIDYCNDEDLSDLLYALSRSTDDTTDFRIHQISLLLISRSLDFVNRLDDSTQSSLTTAHMKLHSYTKEQLYEIIEDRIAMSFEFGAVTEESMELAAEIASMKGDARQALELIWYAGKFADNDTSDYVYPEHVRSAKGSIDPTLLRQVVNDLSSNKMLLLLGIARRLKFTKKANITTGEAKEAYHIACEEYNETPRKHTQIWEYLKDFENLGIIVLEKSGEGQRGTTQLISVHDATANDLEKAVLKRIE